MFEVFLSPDVIAHFLPYGLPSGFILTTMERVKVLGAICFCFGWLVKCITDAVLSHFINKKKATLNQEVTNCQD